jgi:hypothetical protein
MAIDTAKKRFSMMDMGAPTPFPGITPPDGATSADDRAAFLWLYAGITAGVIIAAARRLAYSVFWN